MKINSLRVYAEVLEQGIDFKEYLKKSGYACRIDNVYTKKISGEFSSSDSLVDRVRKVKDIDVLITAIANGREYPLLAVEYSQSGRRIVASGRDRQKKPLLPSSSSLE